MSNEPQEIRVEYASEFNRDAVIGTTRKGAVILAAIAAVLARRFQAWARRKRQVPQGALAFMVVMTGTGFLWPMLEGGAAEAQVTRTLPDGTTVTEARPMEAVDVAATEDARRAELAAVASDPSVRAALDATEEAGGPARDRLPVWAPAACTRFARDFAAASDRHHVDAALLMAQAIVESGCGCADTVLRGDPNVAGARGIMQIVPRWHPEYDTSRVMDHAYTIDYGAKYMSELLSTKSIEDAVGAYNGGGDHWGKGESQTYRRFVMGMFGERGHETSPTFDSFMRAAGSAWIGRTDVEGCGI